MSLTPEIMLRDQRTVKTISCQNCDKTTKMNLMKKFNKLTQHHSKLKNRSLEQLWFFLFVTFGKRARAHVSTNSHLIHATEWVEWKFHYFVIFRHWKKIYIRYELGTLHHTSSSSLVIHAFMKIPFRLSRSPSAGESSSWVDTMILSNCLKKYNFVYWLTPFNFCLHGCRP